ncbi:hypothetical protein EDC01DRAFT_777489 [Geopyxis carbonaria]|nr:hypothetical protein EDC01DRAFT_777489 [Geopyxis carbonaria]
MDFNEHGIFGLCVGVVLPDVLLLAVLSVPFLNGVIKENMRLYLPAAWGGTRVSTKETIVDGERTSSAAPSSTTHAAARFPNIFVRPRNCVGRYMAMMEMRLAVSRPVWEFHVELERPRLDLVVESRNYLMWEKPEVWLRFRPLEELEGR